ncbi:hypothetical protein A1O3_02672 [Capronia epimyces CBS 606.96]|uniref:ARCA protein n=1 Tax=Capronia epimyces CBS 606.96 TaxID=1182542 RepID=W9YIU8_9EURO|nr:uncharacterized protein A1O3_02672 [Capronia epimyces CBS 606.96]EXJ89605.1 hypothetical protein A1O3_02672 [Capronia epimyces CBS 606.96]
MFIDETAELTAIYDQDHNRGDEDEDEELDLDPDVRPASSYQGDEQIDRNTFVSAFQQPSSLSYEPGDVGSNTPDQGVSNTPQLPVEDWQRGPGTGSVVDPSTQEQTSSVHDFWESHGPMPILSPIQSRITDIEIPTSPFLDGLVKKPSSTQPIHTALEVLLLRYFVDVLARWFDLCDPEKHFELIVPQRARSCPSLRNAVLAASARHLTRTQQNAEGGLDNVYYYQGRLVTDLNEETALRYHTECIQDLLHRSLDPQQTRDENLLAAAIILRFYEEIDAPLRDDDRDSELFLRVINVFIDAQIPSVPLVPHSSPIINGLKVGSADAARYAPMPSSPGEAVHSPTTSETTSYSLGMLGGSVEAPPARWRTDGLCQAGFWVAFRQEIYSAFLKQRPLNHDLARCEAFRSFTPAEDAVWADRLIIFCADVLEYCYGNSSNSNPNTTTNTTTGSVPAGTATRPRHNSASSSSMPLSTSVSAKEHWLTLKQQETMWAQVLPSSFEPIYFRDPDRTRGEVFPMICYLSDCHVAGVQHVELAKILLAVYDPSRARLGPGHVANMRALSRELRHIVLRLCGIAMSNRNSPPALLTAFLAIVVCGDYFEDPLEQHALLGLMDELEGVYAWPVGNTRTLLREAWGMA